MHGRSSESNDAIIGPLYDHEGRIDQAIAGDFLLIPWHLEAQENGLLYAYSNPEALSKPRPSLSLEGWRDAERTRALGFGHLKAATPRVLDGFMKLSDAPNEEFLPFAKRWGALDLCTHGLPVTHQAEQLGWGIPRLSTCDQVKPPHPKLPSWCHYGLETFDHWRAWAMRARALMEIGARLKSGRLGLEADWNVVASWEGMSLPRPLRDDDLAAQWRYLARYVNGWCDLVQVAPYLVSHRDREVVIRFGAREQGGLFATIGLQLMSRISRIGSMAMCSSCGEVYKPRRIPDPSRRNFCEDCGRPAAVRMAKQREADRKRKAREMYQAGSSMAQIAQAVGSDIAVVRKWLPRKGQR